ncbi:MAG: hypothetical protein ACRBC3_03845 [Burkholderiaceae bacterium]
MSFSRCAGGLLVAAALQAVSACTTDYQAPDLHHLAGPAEIREQCRRHADAAAGSSRESLRRGIELAAGNPYQYPDQQYFVQCLKANSDQTD